MIKMISPDNVLQSEFTKIIVVEQRLEPVGGTNHERTTIVLSVAFSVVGGIFLFLLLLWLCKRCRKKRKLRDGGVVSTTSTASTISIPIFSIHTEVPLRTTDDVTKRYERSISSLSTKSQVFLVPFAVLPPDFDFSSREVEVKADYVILKDLRLLEQYSSSDYNELGLVNEAYESQESYNPAYAVIPPLAREPVEKQPPYNPTFY